MRLTYFTLAFILVLSITVVKAQNHYEFIIELKNEVDIKLKLHFIDGSSHMESVNHQDSSTKEILLLYSANNKPSIVGLEIIANNSKKVALKSITLKNNNLNRKIVFNEEDLFNYFWYNSKNVSASINKSTVIYQNTSKTQNKIQLVLGGQGRNIVQTIFSEINYSSVLVNISLKSETDFKLYCIYTYKDNNKFKESNAIIRMVNKRDSIYQFKLFLVEPLSSLKFRLGEGFTSVDIKSISIDFGDHHLMFKEGELANFLWFNDNLDVIPIEFNYINIAKSTEKNECFFTLSGQANNQIKLLGDPLSFQKNELRLSYSTNELMELTLITKKSDGKQYQLYKNYLSPMKNVANGIFYTPEPINFYSIKIRAKSNTQLMLDSIIFINEKFSSKWDNKKIVRDYKLVNCKFKIENGQNLIISTNDSDSIWIIEPKIKLTSIFVITITIAGFVSTMIFLYLFNRMYFAYGYEE